MLNEAEFIEYSLVTNLYYLRTLRDFCSHLELSIPSFNQNEVTKAKSLAKKCEELGAKLVNYADGNIPSSALNANIFFTKTTLPLEKLTNELFNYDINTEITKAGVTIKPGIPTTTLQLIEELKGINQEALRIANEFIEFSNNLYNDVKEQKIFIYYYNSLNLYTVYEVKFYITVLNRLINKYSLDPMYVADYEYDFNRMLEALASFIRGECDPAYDDIYLEANNFFLEYQALVNEYENMTISPVSQQNMTENSIELAKRFKVFIEKCIDKILSKDVYFISPPITKDNALTTVNYFLYNLQTISKEN